jgi:hypothetical protein
VTATGRRVRLVLTFAVGALLVAGTFYGHDDWFPVGPFRMYATASKTTGRVAVPELAGVTEDGEVVEVRAGELGLRRAELEGRMPRLKSEPELLAELVEVYEQRWPDAPRLVELRIDMHARRVVDREVQPGEDVTTVARWVRP